MSADLGISRATLFRRVGNREDLMGDVEPTGLKPLVSLDDLGFAVVRLGESFLYSDTLATRTVDLDVATTLLDALIGGALASKVG